MPREPRQRICAPGKSRRPDLERQPPKSSSANQLEELPRAQAFGLVSQLSTLGDLLEETNLPSYQQNYGNLHGPAPPAPEVTLSPEQTNILEIVKKGRNVFFTGPAGTGKSVLLRAIIKELAQAQKKIAITATTGIAALGIGGQTLHSFAGIGIGEEIVEILFRKVNRSQSHKARWRDTEVWIIDEVSMLKSNLFDKLEYIARTVRENDCPFGGIQLVLAGDFFQLPPIVTKGSAAPPNYVFGAKTWRDCFPHPYFLRQVFRQKDDTFIQLLSSMRVGQLSQEQITTLRSLERPLPDNAAGAIPALLLPCNRDVKEFNLSRLKSLLGNSQKYCSMDYAGWDVYNEKIPSKMAREILNSTILALENLALKVGAQVMLIQNVEQGVLVNGSIGRVIDFMTISQARMEGLPISTPSEGNQSSVNLDSYDGLDYNENSDLKAPPNQLPPYQHQTYIEDDILARYRADPTIAKRKPTLHDITGHVFSHQKEYPLVHFRNGRKLLCIPMFFDRIGLLGNTEARRIQVPLILSWAITIHKSQGQTLDFVRVDMKRIFTFGQAYVAVSRATSLDGLHVVNFQQDKVYANPAVIKWHTEWQDWWEAKMREETTQAE